MNNPSAINKKTDIWRFYKNGNDIDIHANGEPIGRMHSVLNGSDKKRDDAVEKARLIIAVPDLLDAAKEALNFCLNNKEEGNKNVIAKLQEAIDKASGKYKKHDGLNISMSPDEEKDFAVGTFYEIPSTPTPVIVKIASVSPSNGILHILFETDGKEFLFKHEKTKDWIKRSDLIDFHNYIVEPMVCHTKSNRASMKP